MVHSNAKTTLNNPPQPVPQLVVVVDAHYYSPKEQRVFYIDELRGDWYNTDEMQVIYYEWGKPHKQQMAYPVLARFIESGYLQRFIPNPAQYNF